jgi:predicted Zn-dependent peptidase
MQLVHRFFDTGKKQEKPIRYEPPQMPEQTSGRIATLEDSHAKTPGFFYGWAIPPARESDHYALELASRILADGESSRLHQKLVRDKALAQEVSGWTDDHRGPDLFGIEVQLAEGARLSDAEKAVDTVVDALAKDGPSEGEMTKVHNRTEASFLFGLQSNLQRATRLGQYELFWGDARLLNAEPANYFAVGRDDIKRVLAKYIVAGRRTLVEVRPTGMVEPQKPAAPAMRPSAQKIHTPDKRTTKNGKGLHGKEIEGGKHKPKHKKDAP